MSQYLQYAYYSHHKCATGWTSSILREICFYLGLKVKTVHGSDQYGKLGSLYSLTKRFNVEFLLYTNAEIREVQKLKNYKGFHVVRDPRDMLISAYFSHIQSHPIGGWSELEEHRKELKTLSKEVGLLQEIEFSGPFFKAMDAWDYDQAHILEIKMEDLTAEPVIQFQNILQHLGLFDKKKLDGLSIIKRSLQYANRVLYKISHEFPVPIPRKLKKENKIHPNILSLIVEKNSFKKKTGGRVKGDVDLASHYRKGQPGDWKNHFTDRVEKKFYQTYGDLIEKLGYRLD